MKKLKIYLDTNTVIDFFINQAMAMKKNEEPKIPEKLKFFLKIKGKIQFITSFFTEAEVARELFSGYDLSEEKFDLLWKNFLEDLECEYITEFNLDKSLVDYPKRIKMRLRTLVNFVHLFIAIKNTCYLVSGDKKLIENVRENKLYDKIISYPEFKELVSSSSSLDH